MLLPITVMIVFSNLSRDIRPSRLEGKFATEGHWAGFLVIVMYLCYAAAYYRDGIHK